MTVYMYARQPVCGMADCTEDMYIYSYNSFHLKKKRQV